MIEKDIKKIAILGAGAAAKRFIDTIYSSDLDDRFSFTAIFDDNKEKIGTEISKVKVVDSIENLLKYSQDFHEIIIAIPSSSDIEFNRIYQLALKAKKKIFTLPSLKDILDEPTSIGSIRDINIQDLIGRDEMQINYNSINSIVKDKIVLITGGAGSIGSVILELCLSQSVRKIICIDNSEYNTYLLQQKLDSKKLVCETADIKDIKMMDFYFNKYKPNIVFHAAALKHVNLQENDIRNALLTNFFGTDNILKMVKKYEPENFVLISTDKAVEPSTNMGMSKRMAEILVHCYEHDVKTEMSIVRFGNVIGSSGSVLNYFSELIKERKPITITHPKVARFFMSIEEACYLVLESVPNTSSCQVFMLDMGDEILIEALAKKLILLNNLEVNKDIKIEYTGLQKGEKLNELLQYKFESSQPTKVSKLIKLNNSKIIKFEDMNEFLDKLHSLLYDHSTSDQDIKNVINLYFQSFLK